MRQSQWIETGATGRLNYTPAPHGDRLLDFSNVGYQGRGSLSIPQVATVVTRSPIDGDDTANIQAAINQVALLPLVDGFRGAVELAAGHYDIAGQLTISASGVVLRGAALAPMAACCMPAVLASAIWYAFSAPGPSR